MRKQNFQTFIINDTKKLMRERDHQIIVIKKLQCCNLQAEFTPTKAYPVLKLLQH